jgi:hypothetical protein
MGKNNDGFGVIPSGQLFFFDAFPPWMTSGFCRFDAWPNFRLASSTFDLVHRDLFPFK